MTAPRREVWAILVLVALTAGVALGSLFWGLHDGGGPTDPELDRFVLERLRVPRLLIGLLVGSTLGLVGAAFQTLFRNPLATPSTVGTSAGATLGAMAALILGLPGTLFLPAATAFAFVGALVTSSLVLPIASSGRAKMEEVLLPGVAITSSLSMG